MRINKQERIRQVAIAELEASGLPLRVINLLEDHLGLIWLDDLLAFTPAELQERVTNLGDKSMKQIIDAVTRFRDSEDSAQRFSAILHLPHPPVSLGDESRAP